jgi:hypothetical protein
MTAETPNKEGFGEHYQRDSSRYGRWICRLEAISAADSSKQARAALAAAALMGEGKDRL